MIDILLVGSDNFLANFEKMLEGIEIRTSKVKSCNEALAKTQKENFDLVVTDETTGDVTGIACIDKLISANPMLNCAAVSSLSHKEFHEATEGLGILMQLPVSPGKDEVKRLLEHLQNIMILTKRAKK